MVGIGYGFTSKEDAKKWLNKAKKYGYSSDRFRKMYEKYVNKAHFKYLPLSQAKPFLKDAYGHKADEYRKKLKKVM